MSYRLRFALMFCPLLLAGCGDDGPVSPATNRNDVGFTRANGTAIAFASSTWVWCGDWEDGEVAVPTVHVVVGSATSYWQLRAVRSDVRIGERLTFPNSFIWDQPEGADMFVYDPPNELSTQSGESSGYVIFEKLDCGSGGGVRFQVDAVIGSELGDLPAVTARGTFASALTGTPGG